MTFPDRAGGPAEYSLTKGWRLAGYLIGIALCGGAAAAIGQVVLAEGLTRGDEIFWTVFAALLFAMGAFTLVSARRSRVLLGDGFVEYRNGFRVRRVQVADIAGYRVANTEYVRTLMLIKKSNAFQSVDIPLQFRFDGHFDQWLSGFEDLNLRDWQAEQQAISENVRLGHTAEERTQTAIALARKRQWLFYACIAVEAWLLIYPRPYTLAVLAGVGVGMIALVLARREIRAGYDDKQSTISLCVMTLGGMLALRAFLDVNLVNWSVVIVPSLLGGAIAAWMLNEHRSGLKGMLLANAMLVWFPGGALVLLNVVLDGAQPEVFPATVISKLESGSDPPERKLYLAPGRRLDAIGTHKVTVGSAVFDGAEAGGAVCIRVRPGAFGLRWYDVEDAARCGAAAAVQH